MTTEHRRPSSAEADRPSDYTHDANGFAAAFVDAVNNNNNERVEHLPGDMSGFCPACGHIGCDNPQ